MGCSACAAKARAAALRQKLNSQTCGDITAAVLAGYRDTYQCIKDAVRYSEVGLTINTLNNRIMILNLAISDKQANPESCKYFNVTNLFVEEANRIINLMPECQ